MTPNPKDSPGQFRLRLTARNGEIIATAESYASKAGAINGIESVQKNAPWRDDRRSDVGETSRDETWRLLD
jgi:uncharacterized protein YegP (UPF0339 family)